MVLPLAFLLMDAQPFDPLLVIVPYDNIRLAQPLIIHSPNLSKETDSSTLFLLNDMKFSASILPQGSQSIGSVSARRIIDMHEVKWKDKGKVLSTYSFNCDGLLSQKAIEVLDSGYLGKWFLCFNNDPINLYEPICEGIYTKDVLESTVTGSLDSMIAYIKSETFSKSFGGSKLIPPLYEVGGTN